MSSSPPTYIESHVQGKPPTTWGNRSLEGATNESHRVFAMIDLYEDEYNDPVYQAKARILNHSIQEIGMGKYQVWMDV